MSILARIWRKSYTPVDTRIEARTVVYSAMTAEDWIDLQFLAHRQLLLDRPVDVMVSGWAMWRIIPANERERAAVTRLVAHGMVEITTVKDCWKVSMQGMRWLYTILRHVQAWQTVPATPAHTLG